jgi:uncharacterized membrane protein YtjA (UPF0391 family)
MMVFACVPFLCDLIYGLLGFSGDFSSGFPGKFGDPS